MVRFLKSRRSRCTRAVLAIALLVTVPACGGRAVPASIAPATSSSLRPADSTSILKKLTVQVTVGSTVDEQNGDRAPRAITIVPHTKQKLTKGQLLVCNFADASGSPGNGTTIEVLNPAPSSAPARFVQSDAIKGCDGNSITTAGYIFAAGLTSGKVIEYSANGAPIRTYRGAPVSAPFADVIAPPHEQFGPENVFFGTTRGGLVSISTGFYGNGEALQVVKGFATGNGSQGTIGPSAAQYDRTIDTLYVVDGVTDTVVAIAHASELLVKNEIVVEPGGLTFDCKHPNTTCASVVYSGSPLDAPLAATLLPNGNLIVSNTQGTANTLVELTPQGQILDTKVVDSSATQGIFGLAAGGTGDQNTVLFFTDANSDTVQELEQ